MWVSDTRSLDYTLVNISIYITFIKMWVSDTRSLDYTSVNISIYITFIKMWVSDTRSLDYTSVNISIYITSFINGYVSIGHTFIRLYLSKYQYLYNIIY